MTLLLVFRIKRKTLLGARPKPHSSCVTTGQAKGNNYMRDLQLEFQPSFAKSATFVIICLNVVEKLHTSLHGHSYRRSTIYRSTRMQDHGLNNVKLTQY